MKMNKNFEEKLVWGEDGEKIIAMYLLEMGIIVQPLYQYKSIRTPYVFYWNNKICSVTAPDITCIENGELFFVECKRKNQWVHSWRYQNSIETGIDQRLMKEYLNIYDITQVPIDIYFIHETEEPLGIYKLQINTKTRNKFSDPFFRRLGKIPGKKGSWIPMSFYDITDLEFINYSYNENEDLKYSTDLDDL